MKEAHLLAPIVVALLLTAGTALGDASAVSSATEACLECHGTYHPGIVEDWRKSRHAVVTPGAAMAVKGLGNKLSSSQVPQRFQGTSVGCAECHTLRGNWIFP